MDQLQKGMMRAREGGLPLIGVDADPEVGHHDGETDRHDYDQHILGSVAPTNAAKVKKALANPEPSTHGGSRLPGRTPGLLGLTPKLT